MSSTSFNVVSESTTCSSIIKAKDDTLNFTDNDLNFNFTDIVDDVSDEEEPAENGTSAFFSSVFLFFKVSSPGIEISVNN